MRRRPRQPRRKSFWATLFGGSDEDEDAEEIRAASRPGRNLFATRGSGQRNPYAGDADSPTAVLQAYNEARNPQPAARAVVVGDAAPAAAPIPAPEPLPARTIVAAAPPPSAFREEMVPPPLPPTRIAGLPGTVATPTGPVLAWQQGPVGQGGSDLRIGRAADLAPLPPRRPDGGDDVVTTGAIAYAPMPPARPGSMSGSCLVPCPVPCPVPCLVPWWPRTRSRSCPACGRPPRRRPSGGPTIRCRRRGRDRPSARSAPRPVAVASAGPIEIAEPAAGTGKDPIQGIGRRNGDSKKADARKAGAKERGCQECGCQERRYEALRTRRQGSRREKPRSRPR